MFNQAFVNIKSYEFNLTLKKAVLKKRSYLHKEKILQKKWMKLEQGIKLK